MVDFRYHLVSIVAVFLALATGIAIGATALNGSVVHDLNSRIRGYISDKESLRNQFETQQTLTGQDDTIIKAVTPALITNQLKGRAVTLVSLPGADKTSRDEASSALTTAGAKVITQVHIEDKAVDPTSESLIATAIEDLAPPSIASILNEVTTPDESSKLGALIGAVIATHSTSAHKVATASAQLQEVLQGLHEDGLTDDQSKATATNLVVIVAGSAVSPQSTTRDEFTIALARAADLAGLGTVMVGPKTSADLGGAVYAIRQDPTAVRVVSTVDDGDRAAGEIAIVRALQQQLKGHAGQYGFGPGASAPFAVTTR